jgi:AcrR family transcriptional regulator
MLVQLVVTVCHRRATVSPMAAQTASRPAGGPDDPHEGLPADTQVVRLGRSERHQALVEAAAALVAQGDVEAVSMEAVAARAGVSRPLVYKHFANRHELLAAVYRQEAAALDAEIVRAVQAADGFEDVIRTFIRAVLAGAASRGGTFATLRRAGARDANLRREQRDRDRRTIRYFARLAVRDFHLPERQARAALAVLLAGIDSILAQWHGHPTEQQERFLEDLYLHLVMGGLTRLAADGSNAGMLDA